MKSPPKANNDYDDIFGRPRIYPSGYDPFKSRPSMISSKYRHKEERRKVLKISLNKLKKIEDPEASLCRSVLINNTMKKLQREARDEKNQKQFNHSCLCENENNFNKNEFNKKQINNGSFGRPKVDFDMHSDFDAKLAEEIVTVKCMEVFNDLVETKLNALERNIFCNDSTLQSHTEYHDRYSLTKRSFDDVEDCEVQDVLKQFYMPPTPRMLTSIDDDEDKLELETKPSQKKIRVGEFNFEKSGLSDTTNSSVCDHSGNFCLNTFINNNITNETTRMRYTTDSESNSSYSCGHASMFSEMQSNVYHNLIASLET